MGTSGDFSAHRWSLPTPTTKGTVAGTGGPCPGCLSLAKWAEVKGASGYGQGYHLCLGRELAVS